ncbi:SEC-C domain-containing protein [Pseudomonas huanghezhanensis]|uniref:SEC-C domain-containing protein n=1 Tax=Pseudomonas huanghezhanensis TaxID=3002903 RepID=UPI0022854148|nr:SEC-C domain-containing protein [Pseudomonas sp. BSw22131]
MQTSIAPVSLPSYVKEFCAEISSLPPQVLDYTSSEGSLPSECFENVKRKVAVAGGQAVFGWQIWEWPGVLVEAEFHSVWQSPAGELFDITPKLENERQIVFVAELGKTYKGERVDNWRKALIDNRIVHDFIRLCEASFDWFGQTPPSGTELEGREARVYIHFEELKLLLITTLKSGTSRNALCACGSGEKYKRCHEPSVEKILQLSDRSMK